jgi:hypothetical protein
VAEDPLDTVLRLVAEGRLTADEAGPILAALDAGPAAASGSGAGPAGSGSSAGHAGPPDLEAGAPTQGAGRSLRIEVRDGPRTVVNLRLPLALGRYALDRVPGLSGDQVERVKAALSSGLTGPVLVVDDQDGGVRIAID